MQMYKVLLIEDDLDLAEAVVTKFANSGFEAVHAPEGRKGAELVETADPDIVLLDLNLPDVDGTEVFRYIRQRSSVPVIMVTGRTDEAERVAGLEIGADDYVTKPFSLNELVARVRAVLRRAQVTEAPAGLGPRTPTAAEMAGELAEPQVLSAAGLEMDVAAHRVQVEGREVKLTPTEFRFLRTLLENAGQVISHEQLLQAGWGGEKKDTHLVEVHIANLRAKVESDSNNPQRIQTVRGFGYRLG